MRLYDIHNPSKATRIIHDGIDGSQKRIHIPAGGWARAELAERVADELTDLLIRPAGMTPLPDAAPPTPMQAQAAKVAHIIGHRGIGDTIHQRGPVKAFMQQGYEVYLETPGWVVFHDLIEKGLRLIHMPTHLHAQARQIEREAGTYRWHERPHNPQLQKRIYYNRQEVERDGSIAQAMFGACGLPIPEKPDFSLPVKAQWREDAKRLIGSWDTSGRPILVYRPITVRPEWNASVRNPDPAAYAELFKPLCEQFFIVSVAYLKPGVEYIVGPEQFAHIKLHGGELSTEGLIGLWAESALVYANAGFGPVLAQAVGTPSITVYGGRESYRTTERAGAHLAPSLGIDKIKPCDCHSDANRCHRCDKEIDIGAARERIAQFVKEVMASTQVVLRGPEPAPQELQASAPSNTLIFGTFYVDSADRDNLTDLWIKLHTTLNQECDFLAVDSQSPIEKFASWTPYDGKRHPRMLFNFPDNIGHLSRKGVTPGKDGWGRAFCKGLEIALALDYSHVVHIEGDSLFRLKVSDIIERMRQEKAGCFSTGVHGMRVRGSGAGWVETGLMLFSTNYLKTSGFVQRYDWPNRRVAPTPEVIVRNILAGELKTQTWRALRADKNQITVDNIRELNLDWVTHQHASEQQAVYSTFVAMALGQDKPQAAPAAPQIATLELPAKPLVKLNLGCGTNKIAGWLNHDADIDISKPLPWADNAASYIFIEHCVEHVNHRQALDFFKEAHRVLAPGGVLRVVVPSLEMIRKCQDREYHQFTTKWQQAGPTVRGAMHAIIYAHGHEMIWSASLLEAALYYCGFDIIEQCEPGKSRHRDLTGVEGHGKVIGDKFNRIESCVFEATKAGSVQVVKPDIAVVVGGSIRVDEDVVEARRLCREYGLVPEFFYTNDKIADFPDGVAVTLHVDKLPQWLKSRAEAGLPPPPEIWAHRSSRHGVTHYAQERKGSVGMLAYDAARTKGHDRVLLCGVPMEMRQDHYLRKVPWVACSSFQAAWREREKEMAPFVRSLSGGFTETMFGQPSAAWLTGKTEQVAKAGQAA